MKSRPGRGVWHVAALGVLAACGVGRDDFIAAWIDADCERAARCGEYTSKSDCLAHDHVTRVRDEELDFILAAVASPRVSYDAGQGEACIERRRAASCDRTSADWRTVGATCASAFRGEVATGGDCYVSAECRDGECPVPACTDGLCCVGTCREVDAPAPRGASCADRRCVEGTFCDGFQVCVDLVAAGGACAAQNQCDYGLNCNAGVCADAPGRGEDCTDGLCENWFGDRCSPISGTCEPLAARGEPCAWGADCQLPLICLASRCTDPLDIGESCAADGAVCRAGAYCDAGVCAPAPAPEPAPTCD